MTYGRDDPLHRHNFKVEIGGVMFSSFQEVEGLEYGREVVEYAEGGNPGHTRKFFGQGKTGNITLRRGISMSTDFWEWIRPLVEDAESDEGFRQNGSIIVCDDSGGELRRWNFTNSIPVRVRGPALDTGAQRELAIEELVLAVETIEVQEVPEEGGEVSEGGNGEASEGGNGEEASESQSEDGGETESAAAEGGNGEEASESQSEDEVSQS
jgi:phage tail-like protein